MCRHREGGGVLGQSGVIIPTHRASGGVHHDRLVVGIQTGSASHNLPNAEHTSFIRHTIHENHMIDLQRVRRIQSQCICDGNGLSSGEVTLREFVVVGERSRIRHCVPCVESTVINHSEFRTRNRLPVFYVLNCSGIPMCAAILGGEENVCSDGLRLGDTIIALSHCTDVQSKHHQQKGENTPQGE